MEDSKYSGYNICPFDLKIAKANPQWVYTRRGDKVNDLHYFNVENDQPLRGLMLGCIKTVSAWWEDGYYDYYKNPHEFDLVLRVPKPKTRKVVRYVNVYRGENEGTYRLSEVLACTYEGAMKGQGVNAVATAKLEWEETE